MKLLKLILTSFVIVAYVQGCYKITKYGDIQLPKSTTPRVNKPNEDVLNKVSGIIDKSFEMGTIVYTIGGKQYNKPYLHYLLNCAGDECRLSFMSFDKEYEQIEMLIEFEQGCDAKTLTTRLETQQDCQYEATNNIKLIFRGNELTYFEFFYNLSNFKFSKTPQCHVKAPQCQTKAPLYVDSGLVFATSIYSVVIPDYKPQLDDNNNYYYYHNAELMSDNFEIFNYENYIAVSHKTRTQTYNLKNNHCVLLLAKYVKLLMSSCGEADFFTFYSYVDALYDHINPSKDIDSFQKGAITKIAKRKLSETINNKSQNISFRYALFDEEEIDSKTKLTVRLQNSYQINFKTYYFLFADKDKECIDKIKYLFYKHLPCTDDLLFSKSIPEKSGEATKVFNGNLPDYNVYQLKLSSDLRIEKKSLTKQNEIEYIDVKKIDYKKDRNNTKNVIVFRGVRTKNGNKDNVDLYTFYERENKCSTLTNNFASLVNLKKTECIPLAFSQIDVVEHGTELREYYGSSATSHIMSGIVNLDDRKINIIFDDPPEKQYLDFLMNNVSDSVIDVQNTQHEKEHPNNPDINIKTKLNASLLDYFVIEGTTALLEFTLTKKKVRLWFPKEKICINNIKPQLDEIIGCTERDNEFKFIPDNFINNKPHLFSFDFTNRQLIDHFNSVNFPFNNLLFSDGKIKIENSSPVIDFKTHIFRSQVCSEKFEGLVNLNSCQRS
jgi:hypothetical protein